MEARRDVCKTSSSLRTLGTGLKAALAHFQLFEASKRWRRFLRGAVPLHKKPLWPQKAPVAEAKRLEIAVPQLRPKPTKMHDRLGMLDSEGFGDIG